MTWDADGLLLLGNAVMGVVMVLVHSALAARYARARATLMVFLLALTALVCAGYVIVYIDLLGDVWRGSTVKTGVSRLLVFVLFVLVSAVRAVELQSQERVAAAALRDRGLS